MDCDSNNQEGSCVRPREKMCLWGKRKWWEFHLVGEIFSSAYRASKKEKGREIGDG